MSILLVRPPFLPTGFDQQLQEPLNLEYLAAVLRRDGFAVRLLDAEFSELDVPGILREIEADRPELIGISLMSSGALAGTLELVEGIRQGAARQSHITVGGQFPTFNTEYMLRMAPGVDSAVLFEAETAIGPLADRVLRRGGDWRDAPGIAFRPDGGPAIHRTAKAPPLVDLDRLPFPSRDLLPRALQLGLNPSVLSSRGCSGHCSFCTIHGFLRESSGKAWRGRSPANVVAEIRQLAECFEVGEIGFLDDDFIGTHGEGKARAAAIADRLIRENLQVLFNLECRPDMVERELFAKLRDSGLRSVFVGVESVTPATLKLFDKPSLREASFRALDTLAELGIEADVGFILYHPYSTMDEVREGFEFLKRYGQCDIHTALNRLFVAAGAPLRERLMREGRLIAGGSGRSVIVHDYEFADPRVGTLWAILHVVVQPLFPWWYNAIKQYRRLRAERKFAAGLQEHDARMARLRSFTGDVDRVVEECFDAAFDYASGRNRDGEDILMFSRRLRQEARDEVQSLARAASCEECLGDGSATTFSRSAVP
jgi:radical SAM superfamily enzyme YgiQ (UPF0313 family)